MQDSKKQFFEEIGAISGACIILDVDGTLRPDGDKDISKVVLHKIEELKRNNEVHILSNKGSNKRKPWRSALGNLKIKEKDTIVIGDKFLTDRLFAKNIGSDFIMVRRKISGREPLFVKITYLIDNIAYKLWKIIKKY